MGPQIQGNIHPGQGVVLEASGLMSPSVTAQLAQGPISAHAQGLKASLQVRRAPPPGPLKLQIYHLAVSPFVQTLWRGARGAGRPADARQRVASLPLVRARACERRSDPPRRHLVGLGVDGPNRLGVS